jgi:hypothetical protein
VKKILILATVLALLAILVVPAAAFADTEGSVQGTGEITQTTVEITLPSSSINFNNFTEGRNPATDADPASDAVWSGSGTVTVNQGTNPSNSWSLTAQSVNDGYGDFSLGRMYCDALARYLDNAMYVRLWDSGVGYSAYQTADVGVTLNDSGDQTYQLGAVQNVSHNDALAGAGAYYIYVKISVAYVP